MTDAGGAEPGDVRFRTRTTSNGHRAADEPVVTGADDAPDVPGQALPDDHTVPDRSTPDRSTPDHGASDTGTPGHTVRTPPSVQPMFAETRAESDEVVAAAVRGDRAAMGKLLAVVRPLIVRYCRSRLGRPERSFASADDVAQEVCVAVLRALPKYRDQGRPFLAFVYGIAQHKVADAHRAAQRNRAEPHEEVPDAPDDGSGPEHRALAGELSERMARLLSELPDKQREIVVLRVMAGMSAEETAETVGSTPGAVRVAQHRALSRLRGLLDDRHEY